MELFTRVQQMLGLTRTQTSQAMFVLFTVFQIIVFVFVPQLNQQVMEGIEGPPYFASLRMIGVKEIGLMTVYSMGILTNNRVVAWMTVAGRLTTLAAMPYFVLVFKTSPIILLGVIQDVVGSSSTAYFLLTEEKQGRRKLFWTVSSTASILPRLALLASGSWEFSFAYSLFTNPKSVRLIPEPMYGAPDLLNLRMFGYMSGLVALYQIIIAVSGIHDGLIYMAFIAHHVGFYIMTSGLLSTLTGKPFHPPVDHLFFGVALAVGLFAGLVYDIALAPTLKDNKNE